MKGKEEFKFSDTSDPLYNRKQRMNYYAVTALLALSLIHIFIKCCIVFIFVFSLNLSAHVFSQSKLVTLDLKEVSVEKFVDAVKQQTGMKMMYNSGVVREAGQVSVQVKDKELSEVLDMVLKKVNLEYELYNDIILIRAKGEVPAGPKVLKGVVKDKSGAVLPGVTVVIKGTTLGAVSYTHLDVYKRQEDTSP